MKYKCYICDKEFDNRYSFAGHMSYHNRTKEDYKKNSKKMVETKKRRFYPKRIVSEFTRNKLSIKKLGKNNPNYKHGINKKLELLYKQIKKEQSNCVVCASDKNLCIHHMDLNHDNNDKNNLVLLCRKHHDRIHQRGYNFKKEKWFVYITEYFSSIQCEGKNHGLPSHFIRLAGCEMKCTWCDSKETWNKDKKIYYKDIYSIFKQLSDTYPKISNLVITGGEPLEQNYYPIVLMAKIFGFTVEVETNGFPLNLRNGLETRIYKEVDLYTISPKVHISNFNKRWHSKRLDKFLNNDYILKFIISKEQDIEKMESFLFLKKIPDENIYIQPVYGNKYAEEICIFYVKKNHRKCLSIQMHKILGIQ